jgi:hypothetical protein
MIMTKEDCTKLVQGIFDGIFAACTQAEPGGKPVWAPSTTVFSMMKPGLAINSKDFRNPWTPGNMNGDQDAALNTASLVDIAPKMSTLYVDSGNTISQIYGQIMNNVQIPVQQPNPTIEKQIQDATDTLYRTVSVADPDTGAITQKRTESQLYREYLDNQAAYGQQRVAYLAAYQASQATQSGKASWPIMAPTMQIPVKTAYDRWRSAGADKVETAIAILSTSSQNALSKVFNEAKNVFNGYGVVLGDTGTGTAPMTYRSSLLPSDWHSSSSSSKWTVVDSKSGSFAQSSSSEFTSGGGSAGYNAGIFSIGASGGGSKEQKHMSAETKNLRVSYEYTIVLIRRPWLTYNLLGLKGWNLQNLYSKGQISNGSKQATQDKSAMPVLPTAFVVVRNVIISADWSKTDYDFLKTTVNAGGKIGIGPFSIGGSYAHSKTNMSFQSAFDGKLIKVPGVQIIGWISQVVPYCPLG